MDEHVAHLQSCMYQYSRAIYRTIKDLIDPYADERSRLEYRRVILDECEQTMARLAADPQYFARRSDGLCFLGVPFIVAVLPARSLAVAVSV